MISPALSVCRALRHPLRVGYRLAALATLVVLAWFDSVRRPRRSLPARAAWASRWLGRCVRVAGIRINRTGPAPGNGLLVANHLSYLDILVLAAVQPTIFVARHDLHTVPVFGRVASHAGTIFLNRQRKRDLLAVVAALPRVVEAGIAPLFFPEGYTTDGRALLPFRSSLFAPAVTHQRPIFPIHINYALEDGGGSVADEVCWWGRMPFWSHGLNLLAKRHVKVRLVFGLAVAPGHDRKRLARAVRTRVSALAEQAVPAGEPALAPGAPLFAVAEDMIRPVPPRLLSCSTS